MYCRNCGKEIPNDSKFCQHCGTKQEVEFVQVINKDEFTKRENEKGTHCEPVKEEILDVQPTNHTNETNKVSNFVYLGRRLVGTMIDKIIILVICLVAIFIIGGINYEFFGDLGTFSALFHMTTESVYNSAIGHVMINYPGELMSQHQVEIDEHFNYLLILELKIVSIFALINIVYYGLCELFFSSSIGKLFWRLKLVNYPYDTLERLSFSKVFSRTLCFMILFGGIIGLRWVVGFNYFIGIILFFLILDLPVFFIQQSLLDIITKTKLVYGEDISGKNNISEEKAQESKCVKQLDCTKKSLNRKSVILSIFLFVSLILTHFILSYFFNDYYNDSNYNYQNNTYKETNSKNYKRQEYEKMTWKEYSKEQFASSVLYKNTASTNNKWKDPSCGPLPKGRLISTLEREGSDSYYIGNKTVTRFYYDKVPKFETIDYGYGLKRQYLAGYVDKKVYYQSEEPIYKYYTYTNSISTYKIRTLASIFPDTDWFYEDFYMDLEKELKSKRINFTYKSIKNKKAIEYYGSDGLKRVITCANGNAYLLETKSRYTIGLDKQSDISFSSISFNHYNIINGPRNIYILISIILICSLMTILCIVYPKKNKRISNRYALSLFSIGILSVILNLIISLLQTYGNLNNQYASPSSVFVLAGSLLTATLIAVPLCVFYYNKSRLKWEKAYIVPSFLKRTQFDKIKKETGKNTYIVFICYPLMALSLLPLGIYVVFLYSIPAILIISIVIWINKWQHWVKESKMSETR